jgi:hypothetical protein
MTVQQLSGALVTPDVPGQYVVRGHNDQQLGAAVTAPVPVIDLGRLLKQDGAGDEAAKLRSALDSWGLILVSNVAQCRKLLKRDRTYIGSIAAHVCSCRSATTA